MKAEMRARALGIVFVLLSVMCPASAGQPAGVDLALCVGATGYHNFPALSSPYRDALALAEELEAAGDFRRIIVLSDMTPDGKPNQARFLPTRKNIIDMVTLLARTAPGTGNIFIYLSGYAELQNGQAQFLPIDAVAGDGVPLAEIVSILDSGRAAVKFVAVDAATPDPVDTVPSGGVRASENTVLVYSHEDEQRPLIDPTTGRGLFSLAIEDTLLSLDGETNLTCGELLSRVNRYMSDYCLDQYIMAGQSSIMHASDGDLAVLKTRSRTAKRRASSSVVISSISPAVPATRPDAAASPEKRRAAGMSAPPEAASAVNAPAAGAKAENLRFKAEELYREKEYEKALVLFLQAAELGDPVSENHIGDIYFEGLGLERDFAKAKNSYQRAAALGYPAAQDNLGFMLEYGVGGPADQAAATEWYVKANDQGYSPATYHLARLYARGLGVDKDASRAERLFHIAREKGVEEIMRGLGGNGFVRWRFELGVLYQEGVAVKKDWKQAADWFKKIAEHPRASEAQRQLGDMFYNGSGVPRDYEQAAGWYRRAAEVIFAFGGK